MNVSWPSAPAEVLACAELLLAWSLVNYVLARDPFGFQAIQESLRDKPSTRWTFQVVVRSIAAGVATLLISGLGPAGVVLAGVTFTGALILPFGRRFLVARDMKVGAEWEISINLLIVLATAWIVGHAHLGVAHALFRVPLSSGRLTALAMASSALAFAGQGGTHIVRGILDKVGTIPRTPTDSNELDTAEYNRGRVIGNLERGVMLLTVVMGAYGALGFLVAAKGLVRIKELEEDRDFAEYFLIGTLGSVLIALALGFLVRHAFLAWWS